MSDETTSPAGQADLVPAAWRERAAALDIKIAPDGTVSKSQLARIEDVSAAAVTKWITTDKLVGPALVGEGRKARIYLPVAFEQLRDGLNINQTTTQRTTAAGRDIAFADKGASVSGVSAQSLPDPESGPRGDDPSFLDEDKSLATERRARLSEAKITKAEADAMLAVRRAEQEAGNWIARADHEAAVKRIIGMCIELMEGWSMTGAEHVAGLVEGLLPNEIQVVLTEATRKDRARFAERCRNLAERESGD